VADSLRVILSKPTFMLLVLQGESGQHRPVGAHPGLPAIHVWPPLSDAGIFGEMPWVAFGTFSTLFFQYAGGY
jgi:hypothetical protein